MRHHAHVAAEVRVSTTNYDVEARRRLARAVVRARERAGYPSRPRFLAVAPGVNKKSLELLETAEPGVGQKILHAVARALPGWTEDTPRHILEGGDAPSSEPDPAAELAKVEAEIKRRLLQIRRAHGPEMMLRAAQQVHAISDAEAARLSQDGETDTA